MTFNQYTGVKGELISKSREVKSKIHSVKGFAVINLDKFFDGETLQSLIE